MSVWHVALQLFTATVLIHVRVWPSRSFSNIKASSLRSKSSHEWLNCLEGHRTWQLLHKGKDKLPISTRTGGIPDRVHLSELLKMYQSLPQFSMREWGQRERKREVRSVSSAEPYYRAQAWLQSRVCSALHAERTEPHAQRNDRDKCPLAPRRGKLFPWLLLMGFYPWSNYSSPQSSPILQRGDVLVLHFLCVWS